MLQVYKPKTRPVGAHVPEELYYEFKALVVKRGFKLQDVVTKLIELFVEDEEFRERILEELRG